MGKKIYVSILNADLGRLAEEIASAEAGGADAVHVDIMDGHFVPNLSLGPQAISAIRACTSLPIDVHLMIERPERLLHTFVEAGADSVTVHQEATSHVQAAIDRVHELGVRAGVAVNPGTPLTLVSECIEAVEMLLVMTVNPGFGGQPLIPSTIKKVARARAWLDEMGSHAALQVDGGVKQTNIRLLADAGADIFVAGTSVFQGESGPAENLRALRQKVDEALNA